MHEMVERNPFLNSVYEISIEKLLYSTQKK